MKRLTVMLAIGAMSASVLSSCATISEEACRAGSWQDIGFEDGEKGRSRSRLANIAETCAKYNVVPDRVAYIRGLEEGLVRYCTPDTGYSSGRNGQPPNAECEAGAYSDYLDAHADGVLVYQLYAERDSLVDRWQNRRDKYLDVRSRLDAVDPDGEGLSAKERRRLESWAARLDHEMDDIRIEIRAFERIHDLDRWTIPNLD
ncbi:DUF2799 domain-containing protein [Algimonas porphyrae]|uniref:DUF2799 domain-containing protein n=2 Tax=Algimonas porphyrae TaxID=1128113 RepID=A0ABQ5UVH3_9PROT|nr:DUF2799 domain-containing protein [Algimonas porphyrae]GLQ19153.1 hypothetical protein GCM10007854_01080 [Algimonas porphyrae]